MKKRLANLLVVLVTMVTGMFVPATAFADPDNLRGQTLPPDSSLS